MQYTEEHYAQMYNDLPEGLKDLVLSGRLAILVSAIGSRHGLNADQVADLEPAIEDVCLGLITKEELVDNILKTVQVDQRVANRIAAEAELEILKPFEAELVVARKQKEDLDRKIQGGSGKKIDIPANSGNPNIPPAAVNSAAPKDVSGHSGNISDAKKVSDWYSKNETAGQAPKTSFDWDKDFAKKEQIAETNNLDNHPEPLLEKEGTSSPNLEKKLDVLTESINKLVNVRFGPGENENKKDDKKDKVSGQMQELLKRLERAEKENEENKRLIKNLQGMKPAENIFGPAANQTKIQIDKERKVDINHTEPKTETKIDQKSDDKNNGNIQITSTSKAIPIISSSVSKDTLDSIVETRNKITPITTPISTKKVLSLDELVSKGDSKIKEATATKPGTLIFPGMNDEKKIDIKNIGQKDNLRQTLLDDLEFLKNLENKKLEIKNSYRR